MSPIRLDIKFMALLMALAPLFWAPPTEAAIIGAIAKAAKAAAAAGKAGKAAKGASAVGKMSTASKGALLAGGAAVAAERAGLVFKAIPTEAGHAAAYVAREADGPFRVVSRAGEQALHAPDDLGAAVTRFASPETPRVDVYLELSAAREPKLLPTPGEGQRLFVLDAEGAPHAVRVEKRAGEALEYVVDVGEAGVDLASFAEAELGEDDSFPWWLALSSGVLAVLALLYLRDRKRRGLSPV